MAKTRAIARRTRYVRVRSRGRSRAGFTLPLAVIAGFGPMTADVIHGFQTGGIAAATNDLLANVTGYDARGKTWSFGLLARGMGPVVAGVLVHKLAGRLGINRALGRAGIPFIRI